MMPMLSCDTMVALPEATASGQTLFAKNSDRPPDECQPLVLRPRQVHPAGAITRCQFVELPAAPVTYRHIGSRPYWCWGYEHGFNEHQVVIGNEALHSRAPKAAEPRLIGMEIIRLGLERGRTAAEAVEVMTEAISRYGQGVFANDAGVRTYDNGYIVADPREAYVVEAVGRQWAVKQARGTVGISNVFSLGADWDRLAPTAEGEAVARAGGSPAPRALIGLRPMPRRTASWMRRRWLGRRRCWTPRRGRWGCPLPIGRLTACASTWLGMRGSPCPRKRPPRSTQSCVPPRGARGRARSCASAPAPSTRAP
ncbi:MAG: hypothetical protein GXY76_03865 [Chloroflexi bacterium]|nr:hypothetical protein [Chloroflexota bacterium]